MSGFIIAAVATDTDVEKVVTAMRPFF